MASWVWATGGEFSSSNGKNLTFNLPAARKGMRAYYNLVRFMPQDSLPLSGQQAQELFMQHKVAALMTGPWLPTHLESRQLPPEMRQRLGIAHPPGPAYVGGSALVVWQHSLHQQAAREIVQTLTAAQGQVAYVPSAGMIPVREEVWKKPPFSEGAHYRAFYQALKGGRTLPPIAYWGMAEEKLSAALGQIWADHLAQPARDLDELFDEHLDPLAHRLNATLNL